MEFTAEDALHCLKAAVISAPVLLQLPDFSRQFVVEADVSNHGVDAVLSQLQHPIAFFSKAMSKYFHLKSADELELMVIIMAVLKLGNCLLVRKLAVLADHQSALLP